jgi:rhodanese-related sulfurtransferase
LIGMGTPSPLLRILPSAARQAIDRGQAVVVDLTSSLVDRAVRNRIPGAIRVSPDEILNPNRHAADVLRLLPALPRDKTIITYCTCPGEEASARLARVLRQDGYDAWALEGGLPTWRAAGYPMEPTRLSA